jgi:hypothetical protein
VKTATRVQRTEMVQGLVQVFRDSHGWNSAFWSQSCASAVSIFWLYCIFIQIPQEVKVAGLKVNSLERGASELTALHTRQPGTRKENSKYQL